MQIWISKTTNKKTRVTYPMPQEEEGPPQQHAMAAQPAKHNLKPVWNLLNDPKAQFEDLSQLLAQCNMTFEEYDTYMVVDHRKRHFNEA